MVGRLIGVVGRLENGTSCGCLRLPPFLVGGGEKFLEVGPGLEALWLASPELAVVVKETVLEHELKSNSNDLGRGVGRVSCGGVNVSVCRLEMVQLCSSSRLPVADVFMT